MQLYSFGDCDSFTELHNVRITGDVKVKMLVSIKFFIQLFGCIKTVCSGSEKIYNLLDKA